MTQSRELWDVSSRHMQESVEIAKAINVGIALQWWCLLLGLG